MSYPDPEHFPSTLYDADGARLAGREATQITDELSDDHPFKTLLFDGPEPPEDTIGLELQDRFWILPDNLGTPPRLPWPLVTELTAFIRGGRRVGLAARDPSIGAEVRNAVLLPLKKLGGCA